ncbi:hypothetical protein, conserved in P.knowlesi [Plasmodium knowlesi strain H]|uniref:Transmembrane protein n=3 Tax=Plasmodium knowlesi TaxID=5850 RepID=A0A1A7VW16_PLAKH|nr:hypothetical protein, conserved in P.knowlesi [Plasmodium knowlesi strain H]OTN63653.1 Uncharacterized protein PKNOH_S140282700 [Plasmodium knowlesi]CAA9991237.1 hypothetical protein, conserved in P.knowlesi [Plasmodium knowlesi strain H]SBO26313.1 hypothetical protein, conserved in P.knowlesi [Plasmodium knowlesi strain H]SBO29054.1 hypothetical protein, conserved in P.knowlesi [Plasmodium knowlesi strain H]VVS80711.1 hypothetical protein, conserved in P.knowlesi [Plasmodium knowlesi strai
MAPFSFIKTSILIFAYLFLWYQTNYQHQVSALSTLKHDVSDSNSLYSSEEDINNGNGHLKTLGSDGPHVSGVRYGDNHPPQGRGEPSISRGGVGSSASSPLKKGGGGSLPFEDPFASLRELHANSAQWNHPRDARNVKDQFQRICKKIFYRRAPKHRCILLLILGILMFCVLFMLFVTVDPTVFLGSGAEGGGSSPNEVIKLGAVCLIVPVLLCALLGYNYYKARKKYIQRKKTKF